MRLLPECFTDDDELQVLGRAKTEALGPVIRCLVWNIFKARRRNWMQDFRILSEDRDLVLLQEAVLRAPSDSLFAESERMQWTMARSFRDPVSGVEHGVKTGAVSRARSAHFYLSRYSEPVSQTQKLLLATEYPLVRQSRPTPIDSAVGAGGTTLLVLNMHAINFVSVQKYIAQLHQLRAVLLAHAGPVILAGDFNTWSSRRLSHFLTVSRAAGLQEAVMQRRSRLTHLNRHLDHVFYRGLHLRTIASLSHVQSSDHAPITATFEWMAS